MQMYRVYEKTKDGLVAKEEFGRFSEAEAYVKHWNKLDLQVKMPNNTWWPDDHQPPEEGVIYPPEISD